jgi:hypothetical protein
LCSSRIGCFQLILALLFVWLYLQVYFLGMPKCGEGESEDEGANTSERAAVQKLIKRRYKELGPLNYECK